MASDRGAPAHDPHVQRLIDYSAELRDRYLDWNARMERLICRAKSLQQESQSLRVYSNEIIKDLRDLTALTRERS